MIDFAYKVFKITKTSRIKSVRWKPDAIMLCNTVEARPDDGWMEEITYHTQHRKTNKGPYLL